MSSMNSSSPSSRIFHQCAHGPDSHRGPQRATDKHVWGSGDTQQVRSSWLPGREGLGAVSAEGTSAHFLPAPFPGQKVFRLFRFHFSTSRRCSCSTAGSLVSRDGVAAGSRKGWIRVISWVTHSPPPPHSCPHLPDPPNLESTGS